LPDHPQAARWRSLGWRWFHQGLKTQIAADGCYMQHSTNYQRLMLQVALWMERLARVGGQPFPDGSQRRLAAAVSWLAALLDPGSGGVPNLGPNDGANILPLSVCSFHDHRPVLQAAAKAFGNGALFPGGEWDELGVWLDLKAHGRTAAPARPALASPHVLRPARQASWAYLRAAHFNGRPGHADQLHVDLWWRGLNVAMDAGTYLYNAAAPWDNALRRTAAHNSVTVNGLDQMTSAGKFLYLDRAQVQGLAYEAGPDASWQRLTAQHDGYRRLGVLHRRKLTALEDGCWFVEDELWASKALPAGRRFDACLHWLLPDWPFEVRQDAGVCRLSLKSPLGMVQLTLQTATPQPVLHILRAGESLYGQGQASPAWGWSSPTYGDRIPALSVRFSANGELPICFQSQWQLPGQQGEDVS
jgi:hypothetical protein